jgi:hypothetical protein
MSPRICGIAICGKKYGCPPVVFGNIVEYIVKPVGEIRYFSPVFRTMSKEVA